EWTFYYPEVFARNPFIYWVAAQTSGLLFPRHNFGYSDIGITRLFQLLETVEDSRTQEVPCSLKLPG
ncbi:MAG: hypothetical protein ACLRQ4_20705, partial [Neglectibacter timonensis]